MRKIEFELNFQTENKFEKIKTPSTIWPGEPVNPLESDDEPGEMARMILRKRCSAINFFINSEKRNELHLEIQP